MITKDFIAAAFCPVNDRLKHVLMPPPKVSTVAGLAWSTHAVVGGVTRWVNN